MAVLDEAARAAIWADTMSTLGRERESVGISKTELRAAVDAIDNFLEANANAINNAFPTAARNGLTVSQKARLVAYVMLKRWGG